MKGLAMNITPPTDAFTLTTVKAEPRIDSRLLAKSLGTKHQSTFELLQEHKADFMELGVLRFEM